MQIPGQGPESESELLLHELGHGDEVAAGCGTVIVCEGPGIGVAIGVGVSEPITLGSPVGVGAASKRWMV